MFIEKPLCARKALEDINYQYNQCPQRVLYKVEATDILKNTI